MATYEQIDLAITREVARRYACNSCGAQPGEDCRGLKGGAVHLARKEAAWMAGAR